MSTRLLIGDVFERMAELPDGSFDLIVTSPPFLALRSYLPDDHPDKAKEIGSEATPAVYLDTLLALTAEWRRLLAPHGSIAIELGDTYAGSGGGGGDYLPGGMRENQPGFGGSSERARDGNAAHWRQKNAWKHQGSGSPDSDTADGRSIPSPGDPGWPLDKSLTGIPTLYAWSLAYGRNLLTGQPSPAGQWRIRNLKPWIRSNPPVGSLGTNNARERAATSYVTVACTGPTRFFDLDAVRTPNRPSTPRDGDPKRTVERDTGAGGNGHLADRTFHAEGGAPPLDWWHPIDALIDYELNQRAGKPAGHAGNRPPRHRNSADGHDTEPHTEDGGMSIGARGIHIRRRLEQAGYLTPQDFHDISPKGYAGAHYAVWPPELVRQLIDEMCPRRVCATCGVPSRRIVEQTNEEYARLAALTSSTPRTARDLTGKSVISYNPDNSADARRAKSLIQNEVVKPVRTTVGWSDCGHGNWRPGRILDPFVGSGTTLAVASGMGRDSVGIDLDERNADLCAERVGMFLEIDYPTWEEPECEKCSDDATVPCDCIDLSPPCGATSLLLDDNTMVHCGLVRGHTGSCIETERLAGMSAAELGAVAGSAALTGDNDDDG